MNNKYTPVIGLEVHVELKTESKMFCGCSPDYFGKEPNTHTCPVCLGLPGALPVPNQTAIEWCIKIALALGCKIANFSKFDRKNYFYPDLSKGYQISQYDLPFGNNGSMKLSTGKTIKIRRVHMEEDTAKLTHHGGGAWFTSEEESEKGPHPRITAIDFNRSGVPLVEIVTEPDFKSATEVKEYLQNLQQIVRYLDVSNADMEKGDMRLEPNISLNPTSHEPSPGRRGQGEVDDLPPYKVEVKNINSFRFVEKAINFEINRQAEILDSGKTPAQETRGWDENKNITFSQRVKEEANDYRYFPDPDIPPIITSKDQVEALKKSLPELPWEKEKKFVQLGLSPYNANVSAATITRAEFIEGTIHYAQQQNIDPSGTINYVLNRRINDISTLTPEQVVEEYKNQTSIKSIDKSELDAVIREVIIENTKAVEDFKKGKESVIMYLVGQVMRTVKQKIDVKLVKTKLLVALKK